MTLAVIKFEIASAEPIELKIVILIIDVILFFVTLLGSVPAMRYLMALKPTEVLHGK